VAPSGRRHRQRAGWKKPRKISAGFSIDIDRRRQALSQIFSCVKESVHQDARAGTELILVAPAFYLNSTWKVTGERGRFTKQFIEVID